MEDVFSLTLTEDLAEIEEQSEKFIEYLLTMDKQKKGKKDIALSNIDNLGMDVQRESALQSERLKVSARLLSDKSSDGNSVANTLLELKSTVEELDPDTVDFTKQRKGIFKIFSPVKKYFKKYKSRELIIDYILYDLEKSREILKRDNITLTYDQQEMYELTEKLSKYIKMGIYIDKRLSEEIDIVENEKRKDFLLQDVQFPLRQRIADLQQQKTVNQQGVLAVEVIKENNRELIRGIERARMLTVSALRIAVLVSQALADHELVLDKINMLNHTVNRISDTVSMINNDRSEIDKGLTSALKEADKLKQAFSEINDAVSDITAFRNESMLTMKETIAEFDRLINKRKNNLID